MSQSTFSFCGTILLSGPASVGFPANEQLVVSRSLLNKTFGSKPMSLSDIRDTQRDLEKLERETSKRIARIPYVTLEETYENNRGFNKWARLVLSALGDQNWWLMHSPVLHRSISQAWNEFLPRYRSEEYHMQHFGLTKI